MKKQLPKRFYVFMMMMCSFIVSNAQIVYTDVIPDSNMITVYNLDLNNDGVTDFHITQGPFNNWCGGYKALIISNDSNSIYGYGTFGASKLILNASIDSNAIWIHHGFLRQYGATGLNCLNYSSYGTWTDSSDGYVGLKLKVLTQTYYGWVRLSIFPNLSGFCRIKDYAYNSIPEQAILAGDTGNASTGIIHKNFGTVFLEIYPNPATNSASIKFPSYDPGEIQIANLFGQIVFSEKVNTEQKQIDVSRFTAGIYVVRWSSGEKFETKIFSVIK